MNRNALVYLVILVALLVVAQFALNDYYLRILAVVAINIILTVSLNLTNGFTGDFSLGHAAFMSIGAYVSAILTLPVAAKATLIPDLSPWLGQAEAPFIAAVVLGGLLAAVVASIRAAVQASWSFSGRIAGRAAEYSPARRLDQ